MRKDDLDLSKGPTDGQATDVATLGDSAATHTPGPWRAGIGDDGGRQGEFELACVEHHLFGAGIYARGDYYSDDYAEHAANARLMAAAPELLAAVKELVAAGDLVCDDVAIMLRLGDAIDAARAAIKAAEGHQ